MLVVVVVVVHGVVMGMVGPLVTWTKVVGQPSAGGPETCQDRGGVLGAGRARGRPERKKVHQAPQAGPRTACK